MTDLDDRALRFTGATVRYAAGQQPAVDRLDLVVEHGARVALVGPSGAGKSTILGLANGLVAPDQGCVTTLGVDTRQLGQRQHRGTRARIGTVHQSFALVPSLRVAHNVAAGRLGAWSTIRALSSLIRPSEIGAIGAALDRVGIGDRVWDRTDQLSGGQQQRVATARVLFQQPDLLLADEPVSSLDPARSVAVLEALLAECDRRPGTTCLVSLHQADLALEHFERIIGVRDGRVEFDLAAAEVDTDRLAALYSFEQPDR